MRNYEVMLVLRPDLDEETVKGIQEKFTTLIADNGGEIVKVNEMGKRRLAYEINDYREGIYTVIYFHGNSDTVNELDRVIRITENILRFIIVKEEE